MGRIQRSLSEALFKTLDGATTDWDTILPLICMHYNANYKDSIRTSPYSLMFGRPSHDATNPDTRINQWLDSDIDLEQWLEQQRTLIQKIYPEVRKLQETAREKSKKEFSASHRIVPPLKIGMRVMVRDEKRTSKSHQPWVGPYSVKDITPTGSYILKDDLPGNNTITRAIDKLKPINEFSLLERKEMEGENQEKEPELKQNSAIFDEENIHRVDKILSHKKSKKGYSYQVKWHGFPASEATWEPSTNFLDQNVLNDYWSAQAPRRSTKRKRKQQTKQ
jgi:hypothetical protein